MDPNSRDMLPKLGSFFPSHHVEDAGKAFVVEALRENLKGNPPLLPQSWDCAQKLSFHQWALIRLFKSGHPLGWGCCSSFFNTFYCPREENQDAETAHPVKEQLRSSGFHHCLTESSMTSSLGGGGRTKKHLDQVLEPPVRSLWWILFTFFTP